MPRQKSMSAAVIAVGALLSVCPVVHDGAAATAAAKTCDLSSGPRRTVSEITDANTLQLDDGSRVRLLGARVPTGTSAEATKVAQDAVRALEHLVLGRNVRLSYLSPTNRRDRYGNRLAFVFRDPVVGETSALWLQADLLRRGLAQAYGLPGLFACHDTLIAAEGPARTNNVGIWSLAAFQPRKAERAGALRQYRGTYQIVEGRVLRASKFRRGHYLDFGETWRRDFTIHVPYAIAKIPEGFADTLSAAVGRQVRVRGWVTISNGPMIVLDDARQIEWLGPPTSSAREKRDHSTQAE